MMKITSSLRFLLAVLLLSGLSFVAYAAEDQASDDEPDASVEALESAQLNNAIANKQEEASNTTQAIMGTLTDKVDKLSDETKQALILINGEKVRQDSQPMPDSDNLTLIANERAISGVLTDDTRHLLDEVNYEIMQGYTKVPGAGYFFKDNPYAHGGLSSIKVLYPIHVSLFCDPTNMENPPTGCGADRVRAGIEGNENFVDMFLSERTWPKETVADALQLARSYYFGMRDRPGIAAIRGNRSVTIEDQRTVAKTGIRMAMLDYLAARRAPTSTATQEVLQSLLQNYAVTGRVSGLNYDVICKTPDPNNMLEQYVCNLTNLPDPKKGGARIISQAAIDRIMQYDYYMSPNFYAAVNSPGVIPRGTLDRMEVMMVAQQLTQDYYFLRMLQMKTAADAIAIAAQDD